MTRWLWIAVMVGVCVACANSADAPQEEMMGGIADSGVAPARRGPVGLEMQSTKVAAEAPSLGAVPMQAPTAPRVDERKIIRHGSVSLEVSSVEETLTGIKGLVDAAGGYVTNESVSQDEYSTKSGSILCRVPSDRLDQTLDALRELGEVDYVSINADDITDQYFDLEVHMENQKELEVRLVELLKRPTNELDDLLAAERELARVRTEIDSMEGRKRLWDNQIAYSTISVSLHEPAPAVPGGGVFRALWSSFGRAGENFVLTVAELIAVTGTIVPIGLAILVAWWGGRKVWRRRKKSTDSPTS